jgi:hypothetical protein
MRAGIRLSFVRARYSPTLPDMNGLISVPRWDGGWARISVLAVAMLVRSKPRSNFLQRERGIDEWGRSVNPRNVVHGWSVSSRTNGMTTYILTDEGKLYCYDGLPNQLSTSAEWEVVKLPKELR